MSKIKEVEYKILSFSTTMRNPQRIVEFLKVLLPYENHTLSNEVIMQIIAGVIKNKLYITNYERENFKEILLDSDRILNSMEVQSIIENSPQNHKEAGFDKGWESRFDTLYKLSMEFGFCFYEKDKPLLISNTGHLLIDAFNEIPTNDTKINNVFLNALMKYQRNNPFRKVKNDNVPLVLLLQTMSELKEKVGHSKISRNEIPFLLCWRDSDYKSLAAFIINFRAMYSNPSNEVVYEKCLELLESTNTTRFKISQICVESVDEYIRKMRITGIISLRGAGRYIDFNTFEKDKIDYILKNYSKQAKIANKEEYFKSMGQIDTHILDLKENIPIEDKIDLKLSALQKFANSYTKEQIYNELEKLKDKNSKSNDLVFKFIPEPTRFEFLTAIALKQNLDNVEVLPNYSIDDEGLPKNHASGNMADIICKDSKNNAIFEVSLIVGRKQLELELIPITRHLRESMLDNVNNFAVFVAPKIFEDSKLYVEFLEDKKHLNIYNFDIPEFIQKLKNTDSLSEIANA